MNDDDARRIEEIRELHEAAGDNYVPWMSVLDRETESFYRILRYDIEDRFKRETAQFICEAYNEDIPWLLDRLEHYRSEAAQWQEASQFTYAKLRETNDRLEAAQAEIERLRLALTFYANAGSYNPFTTFGPLFDKGTIARAVLAREVTDNDHQPNAS